MKIRIYTDGACSGNPGPGGWAMVFNTDDKCKTYSGYEVETTNNRMELLAFLKSLEKIYKDKYKQENTYEIFSDSAYVVNGINCGWLYNWKMNGWKTKTKDDIKNRDLWERIEFYISAFKVDKTNVNVIKVKGHAGNTFNELVDKLAKKESVKAASYLGK